MTQSEAPGTIARRGGPHERERLSVAHADASDGDTAASDRDIQRALGVLILDHLVEARRA